MTTGPRVSRNALAPPCGGQPIDRAHFGRQSAAYELVSLTSKMRGIGDIMSKIIIAIAAFIWVFPAAAQNQQLSTATPVIGTISVNEMLTILQSVELSAKLVEENADGVKFIEASVGGSSVYFALGTCDGAGQDARCQIVEPFGYFDGAGVILSHLNTFNLTQSRVSMAGLGTDGDGIIVAKFYLTHGVTMDNFLFQVGLYFLDIDTLMGAITPGAIAQISYGPKDQAIAPARAMAGNSINVLHGGKDRKVNRVGVDRASFMTDGVRAMIAGGR